MRVLYLTQWFEPEPAFKGVDFVKALQRSGLEVEVATGFPNYPGGKLYPGFQLRPYLRTEMDGLTVHRLYLYPSHSGSAVKRAINYLSFFLSCLIFGLLKGGRYDVIYVYHPPITPPFAVALFSRLWRRPFIVDVQDLWPDSAIASQMVPPRFHGILSWMSQFVYRHATHLIAQSHGMYRRLADRSVPETKLSVIYNWSNYRPATEATSSRLSSQLDIQRINAVYGGNLGQAQSLESVVRAAILAQQSIPDFRLHLFGEGIERAQLINAANAAPRGIVQVHKRVSREEMDRIFEESDMLVLQLNEDPLYEITIPSKLQHYLSCGKPIIAGLRGEAAELIRKAEAGLVSDPGDIQVMAGNMITIAQLSPSMRREIGFKGFDYYNQHMCFEQAIKTTVELIRSTKKS